MPPLFAAAVLAVAAVTILAEPRPPHSPPRLVLGGQLAAVVQLAPAAAARIRGDR